MGMFDWVRMPGLMCYNCGEEMPEKGWQSKSGECLLDELEPKDVKNFYQMCPGCDAWNEYVTEREIILRGVKLIKRGEDDGVA